MELWWEVFDEDLGVGCSSDSGVGWLGSLDLLELLDFVGWCLHVVDIGLLVWLDVLEAVVRCSFVNMLFGEVGSVLVVNFVAGIDLGASCSFGWIGWVETVVQGRVDKVGSMFEQVRSFSFPLLTFPPSRGGSSLKNYFGWIGG